MSTNPSTDVIGVASHALFGFGESPHRCSTLLCGAPATMRRPRNNCLGEHLGWYNCCPTCFTRNQHDREMLWEKIIQPNASRLASADPESPNP